MLGWWKSGISSNYQLLLFFDCIWPNPHAWILWRNSWFCCWIGGSWLLLVLDLLGGDNTDNYFKESEVMWLFDLIFKWFSGPLLFIYCSFFHLQPSLVSAVTIHLSFLVGPVADIHMLGFRKFEGLGLWHGHWRSIARGLITWKPIILNIIGFISSPSSQLLKISSSLFPFSLY